MTVCHNSPQGAGDTHAIGAGNRRLDLKFAVDWGDKDLRDAHEKPLTFCSFACLAEWASAKAIEHDGHVLQEGS